VLELAIKSHEQSTINKPVPVELPTTNRRRQPPPTTAAMLYTWKSGLRTISKT
jgi:hypothetical protein